MTENPAETYEEYIEETKRRVEVQKELIEIRKVTNLDPETGLRELFATIVELAETWRGDPRTGEQEIAAAAKELAYVGVKVDDLVPYLRTAIDLAENTHLRTDDAARAVGVYPDVFTLDRDDEDVVEDVDHE